VEEWVDDIPEGGEPDASRSDRCASVVSAEPRREEGRGEILKGSEEWVEEWVDDIPEGGEPDASRSDRCASVVSAEPRREEGRGEILKGSEEWVEEWVDDIPEGGKHRRLQQQLLRIGGIGRAEAGGGSWRDPERG
jgi:hypothetical protein